MNLKFVWQSFTDLRLYLLALVLIVGAGVIGVSALIWLAILFLAFVPVSYLESFRTRVGPARQYFQAAKLTRTGRLREAAEIASAYAQRRPKDPQGWEALALTTSGLGRPEEALAFADKAVLLKKRWQGFMIRGQTLLSLACPAAALEDLTASYKIRAHPFTRMLMSEAFFSLRLMDTALGILNRSSASVRVSLTLLALADCHRLRGEHDQAMGAYERAERKARREVSRGMPCGSIFAYSLAQLSRDLEAEQAADAMLVTYERETLSLRALALVSLRRGELDAVEQLVRRMVLITPQSAVSILADPQFTPLFREERFRQLFGWAYGGQRQIVERVLNRQPPALEA